MKGRPRRARAPPVDFGDKLLIPANLVHFSAATWTVFAPPLTVCPGSMSLPSLSRSNRRGTDPYARWCGRGGAARRSPIPINPLPYDCKQALVLLHPLLGSQIGRASCRERVCQYV